MIMDVTNNVVWEGFLKDTKIAVSELYDNKKVSYLQMYYREQKTHTFIHKNNILDINNCFLALTSLTGDELEFHSLEVQLCICLLYMWLIL